MKTIALILCVFMLSGCAAFKEKLTRMAEKNNQAKYSSYISADIGTADADTVSNDIANFLANHLPAAKTTIGVDPLVNPLHEKLVQALLKRGFGIVDSTHAEAIPLVYKISRLDGGILIRLRYQGKYASRFYDRANDGSLALNAKFTIREATN